MKPSELLAAARFRLAAPGAWWDGSAGAQKKATICASTAISVMVAGDATLPEAVRARGYLQRAIGRDAEDGVEVIYTWNDKPGRTLGEVLAAYDRAIALAEIDEMVTEVCA